MPGLDLTDTRFLMRELGLVGIDTDVCKYCGFRGWDAHDVIMHMHETHGLSVAGEVVNPYVRLNSYVIQEEVYP